MTLSLLGYLAINVLLLLHTEKITGLITMSTTIRKFFYVN
jgi:hypothetical protein